MELGYPGRNAIFSLSFQRASGNGWRAVAPGRDRGINCTLRAEVQTRTVAGYDLADNPLNKIEWAFAAVEVVHIASLAVSIATIAIVDMSLLGLGLRDQSAAKLRRRTGLSQLAGLTLVISSGLAIFTTDPLRYYYSPTFRLKMVLLLAGILFNYTIHRRMTQNGVAPVAAKAAGAVSLLIWISVIFCGLFFAFTAGGY